MIHVVPPTGTSSWTLNKLLLTTSTWPVQNMSQNFKKSVESWNCMASLYLVDNFWKLYMDFFIIRIFHGSHLDYLNAQNSQSIHKCIELPSYIHSLPNEDIATPSQGQCQPTPQDLRLAGFQQAFSCLLSSRSLWYSCSKNRCHM